LLTLVASYLQKKAATAYNYLTLFMKISVLAITARCKLFIFSRMANVKYISFNHKYILFLISHNKYKM